LNVFYGDVKYIVSLAVMLLFYLTPVFYQVQAVGEKYQIIFTLNPIAVLVQGYRGIFFYGTAPEWGPLFLACIISGAILGLGYLIYRRQLSNIFDAL
jgi:ABC-type polysaccharide/polyol phosphate export permease